VLFHGTLVVVVFIAIFTMLCVALLPLNYGAYAVFGTPAFVLLAESSAGNWHLTGLRVINTLIGAALAVIGARVLWPVDEWNRLPEFAAAAIRSTAELLRRAAVVARNGESRAVGELRDARRAIALAAANAEDSFQRLLAEYDGPSERLEPIMACLVYTRRLAAAIAGLALIGAPDDREAIDAFVSATIPALDDLADAIANGRPPSPRPPPAVSQATPGVPLSPTRARMRRISRQLTLLHDAVDRWMSSDAVRRRTRRTAGTSTATV
jgi:uncharacterized membrane protein YccC